MNTVIKLKRDSTKRGKIFVKDTTAPTVTVKEITVGVNEEFEPYEFLDSCDDLSLPCKTSYKKDSYAKLNEKAGKYDLEIVVEDKYGNKVSKDVVLNVSETESLLSLKQNDDVVVSMTQKIKIGIRHILINFLKLFQVMVMNMKVSS